MKKVIFFVFIIISIIIINNLVGSILSLWQKHDLVVAAETERERAKSENYRLKQQLAQVKKSDFIEKQARDELSLVKPGEQIVILPDESKKLLHKKKSPTTSSNIEQWWNLFAR